MRPSNRRSGFTLFQLLIVGALLLLLLGLFLAGMGGLRERAAQAQSSNNLKQLMLALHSYHDAMGRFPPGVDDNHFSTSTQILPYIEQDNVYKNIDLKKSVDDKANEAMRAVRIKVFESPLDPQEPPNEKFGPTNYLYNNLVFFHNSKIRITDITDGTSNTVALGETLKGDGKTKAEDVKRQHVLLGKDDLKGIKPDAGVKFFKDDKNIAGDRCASWMDGRFLQGTFNGELKLNDEQPDVSCAGLGGVSALRSLDGFVIIALCDGSTRRVGPKLTHTTWKAALTPNGGEVFGADW
jgi:type II secretory pathway pseudopilin PulG